VESLSEWFADTEAWVWAVVLVGFVVGTALSAWVLNLSCGLCRVQPPGFLKALLIVIAISLAGSIGTIFLGSFGDEIPSWIAALYSVAIAVGVLCLMLPTDPLTAFLITLVQSCIWIGIGIGLTAVGFVALTAMAG